MAIPSEIISFDIETIPDKGALPEEWSEGKFPKPIQHQIVAISFVRASIIRANGAERFEIKECRSGGVRDASEKDLLEGFWALVRKANPRLISWNGRSFDIPVLLQRSLIHGVSAARWYESENRYSGYRYRYDTDWHCDLMDVLSDFGASARLTLEETARAVGIPGKIGGHGSEVLAMYEAGDIDQIRAYCEVDTMIVFCLYVRWAFSSGLLRADGHNESMDSTIKYLSNERARSPHFGQFLDEWLSSSRPNPMKI